MSKYLASSLIGVVLLCTGTFVGYAAAGVTERISVNSDGIAGNGHSGNGPWRFVSGDGRYVVFHSQADNLVQGDENESSDIFIHDRDTDVTEIVDVSNLGRHGNRHSVFPEISADGRHIVFRSWKPRDNNPMTGEDYLYVHDRVTKTTEMVSISSTGEAAKFATSHPSIKTMGVSSSSGPPWAILFRMT